MTCMLCCPEVLKFINLSVVQLHSVLHHPHWPKYSSPHCLVSLTPFVAYRLELTILFVRNRVQATTLKQFSL